MIVFISFQFPIFNPSTVFDYPFWCWEMRQSTLKSFNSSSRTVFLQKTVFIWHARHDLTFITPTFTKRFVQYQIWMRWHCWSKTKVACDGIEQQEAGDWKTRFRKRKNTFKLPFYTPFKLLQDHFGHFAKFMEFWRARGPLDIGWTKMFQLPELLIQQRFKFWLEFQLVT